jgi:sugar lactone lactonase YvrE
MNFLAAAFAFFVILLPSALAVPQRLPSGPGVFAFPGNATFPEGVAFHTGTQNFYSASTRDGTIYRGTLTSPVMTPLILGKNSGMVAAYGIKIHQDRLLIAGGASGMVFVFSLGNLRLLHRFSTDDPGSFLNDLAVDEVSGDVYITDSRRPTLWKIPGEAWGNRMVNQQMIAWANLTGIVKYEGGFNGNGIAFTPERKYVIMADKDDLALYRVGVEDAEVVKIDAPIVTSLPSFPSLDIE